MPREGFARKPLPEARGSESQIGNWASDAVASVLSADSPRLQCARDINALRTARYN